MQKTAVSLAQFAGWCVRRLPLISGLPECKYPHYRDAVKKVVVNLILSTSPLWLGSLIVFSVDVQRAKTFSAYVSVLRDALSEGEMLIFATAAIAPMFYFALTPPRAAATRDFPGRISHIVCGLLIFMICTALFGAQRSGVKIDPNFILPGSLVVYCIAILMIFVATVYRNWRDSSDEVARAAEEIAKTGEDRFLAAAMEHRNE
jgi:hypothetical protein